MAIPPRLAEAIDALDLAEDRAARIQMLIDLAKRYREVPPAIARRPFDEAHRVPGCESEAFVWVVPAPDGTVALEFAVENPQGISARALAVLLRDALSGRPAAEAAALDPEVVYEVFGRELSMGKALGLTGMVGLARALAAKALAAAPAGSTAG